jgi:hypothetical protein
MAYRAKGTRPNIAGTLARLLSIAVVSWENFFGVAGGDETNPVPDVKPQATARISVLSARDFHFLMRPPWPTGLFLEIMTAVP